MKIGSYSPHGKVQHIEELAPGIFAYSTSSHGGIKLDRRRNSLIPSQIRVKGGFYEEDCEWAIPIFVFKDEFDEEKVQQAKQTFKNWNPDGYEFLSGEKVAPEDSYVLRKRIFEQENEFNYVVIAASMDSNDKSLCNCTATIGGERGTYQHQVEKFSCVIPTEEYRNRHPQGFVIKPEDAQKYQLAQFVL